MGLLIAHSDFVGKSSPIVGRGPESTVATYADKDHKRPNPAEKIHPLLLIINLKTVQKQL